MVCTLVEVLLVLDYFLDFGVGVVVGGRGREQVGAGVLREGVEFGGAAALEVVAHFWFRLVLFSLI